MKVSSGTVSGAGIGLGHANWRLNARVGLGSTARLDAGQSARLELVPATVGLESGYVLRSGTWSVEPRLGVELGVTRSRTYELAMAQRTTFSLATTAMARINRSLGAGVQIWVGVGSAVPVWWPRWIVAGTPLHEMGAALRTELGLESTF